jgi:hypothetical protein
MMLMATLLEASGLVQAGYLLRSSAARVLRSNFYSGGLYLGDKSDQNRKCLTFSGSKVHQGLQPNARD